MPFYGQRKYHHSVEINKPCCKICGKPFLMYWKDEDERNGFSDTVTHIGRDEVHFTCTPNAKSLKELNEDRKRMAEEYQNRRKRSRPILNNKK